MDPQGDTYGLSEVLFCPKFTQYEDGKCVLQNTDAILSNSTIYNPIKNKLQGYEGVFFNVSEE